MQNTITFRSPRNAVNVQLNSAALAVRNIFRILFSEKVSIFVAVTVTALIWWFNLTAAEPGLAAKKVSSTALFLLPWAIVWVYRLTFSTKGGDK